MGYRMRHFLAGAILTALARLFGLSQAQGAGFGATAVTGYEVYQSVTQSGTPEWRDVGTGLAGVALVSLVPNRKPDRSADALIDLNIARIRSAITAECDSVRAGTKTFADSSMRAFARSVCR